MSITLTEKAANEIKRILSEQKKLEPEKDIYIRVGIKGGGCSGFTYTLDLTDRIDEFDKIFESHGVKIVCDMKSYLYLNGTTIDFNDDLLNRGFVFRNPNAKQTCSCGASFGV